MHTIPVYRLIHCIPSNSPSQASSQRTSALDHKVLDNAVELGAFKVQRHCRERPHALYDHQTHPRQ